MSRNPLYRLATFRAALVLAKFLPRGAAQSLAGSLGSLSYSVSREAREALRANLALVTGREGRALDELCQANFASFLRMLADYFHCATAGPEEAYALLEEWRGFEHLEEARARGKGVIVVTGHLGNWELGGALLTQKGLPMTVVTLDEPTSDLTRWRDEYRRRMGIRTITVGSDKFSFVEMISTLRRNEVLAMLVERPPESSGTSVDFFGRKTLFSTGPALLWQHTGAAVVPAFVVQKEGGKYLSFAEPIIPFASAADPREAIVLNTQHVATIFEQIIRHHPDQWYNYVPIWRET